MSNAETGALSPVNKMAAVRGLLTNVDHMKGPINQCSGFIYRVLGKLKLPKDG